MSIYWTLARLMVPRRYPPLTEEDWTEVYVLAVPSHVGHPAPGYGYEDGDPYSDFLPPPWPGPDPHAEGVPMRAVVFVEVWRDRQLGQRYIDPLLVLSGEEYRTLPFPVIVGRLSEAIENPTRGPESERLHELADARDADMERRLAEYD